MTESEFKVVHFACSMFGSDRVYKHAARCPRPDADTVEEATRNEGRAEVLGLLGMAFAIRNRTPRQLCEGCRTSICPHSHVRVGRAVYCGQECADKDGMFYVEPFI